MRAGEATNVSLFCGGRGSATLIRDLLRRRVHLSLIVNAYDDGLSTGSLRNFIPGMLGPSDFRKNLTYLLDLYSAQQYSLQRLLEYRLPKGNGAAELHELQRFVGRNAGAELTHDLSGLLFELEEEVRNEICKFLKIFFDYDQQQNRDFDYEDCSLGNLVFAGAYLETGSFNAATGALGKLCGSQADLINVSRGECRTLVALKEDGQLLSCEAQIVGQQTSVPIRQVFFMERPIGPEEWAEVADRSVDEQENWLREREMTVELSDEAAGALSKADIVVYGPGTQHSSLLPSYRIASRAIRESRALIKAIVLNLREDRDIQGFSATDLVDRALLYMGDCDNAHRVITHALYNASGLALEGSIALDDGKLSDGRCYRGVRIVRADFQNPVRPEIHNGFQVVQYVLNLYDNGGEEHRAYVIDIYVDLLGRSLALDGFIQDFLELDWKSQFDRVRLRINDLPVPALNLPDHLMIERTNFDSTFSEAQVLRDWLENGDSDHLVTLTGDGEYRLRDIFIASSVLRTGTFGAVLGSRNQSRRQFQTSLRAAYGEGFLLFFASTLWAFLVAALFVLRFRLIFSDPLTGFRMYQRNRLNGAFREAFRQNAPRAPSSIVRLLLRNHVEIAEIPVQYRTFAGFTKVRWRIARAVQNLRGIMR